MEPWRIGNQPPHGHDFQSKALIPVTKINSTDISYRLTVVSGSQHSRQLTSQSACSMSGPVTRFACNPVHVHDGRPSIARQKVPRTALISRALRDDKRLGRPKPSHKQIPGSKLGEHDHVAALVDPRQQKRYPTARCERSAVHKELGFSLQALPQLDFNAPRP